MPRETLNIAMLSYHTCPLATLGGKHTGGMNVYVRDLTRALGQLGVHVDVFTRSQDEHVPHVLHDLGYGNRIVHIPAGPEKPLPKSELVQHIPAFARGILDFAQRKGLRYHLIHSHYWMSGIAARDLKAAWQAPVVHMFHTLGRMKNRIAGEQEGDYRIQGEHEVLALADRIVAATPAEEAQLRWLYRVDTDKVVIIPPGVDLSRFYPIPPDEAKAYLGLPPEHQMLLFVGRIEPVKGLDVLLQAMAAMKAQGVFRERAVCLSIIGGDPEESEQAYNAEMARIQSLRRAYGLEDLVAFLGRRGQETLPYYYSAAEVVVVPSHYESFGMVALEAMACGTPVVASHVGGLAYLVRDGETGFLVPSGEPEALAARLTLLLEDRTLRTQMGHQAATYARAYAWERIADRMVQLYKEVLGEKQRGRRTPNSSL